MSFEAHKKKKKKKYTMKVSGFILSWAQNPIY